jgi:hypothetical protein
MDELERLLSERVTDFDDPRWIGHAVLHALASMDREARAIELSNYALILAGDNEPARGWARGRLEAADRAVLELHCRLRAILRGGDG